MWLRSVGGTAWLRRALSTAPPEVLFDAVGSTRVITLNRPKALNALNLNMVRQMYPVLKEWNSDKDVELVVIKGAGGKAFCSGGDVLAVTGSAKRAAAGKTCTEHYDFFAEEYVLNHLIGTLTKPFVALIDGIVMGGGSGVSINGRFRVATERTLFSMPETALGLFPDVGAGYFLPRLKGSLGMYLALTSYRLKGADVFHSGLATHYIPSSSLPAVEEALTSMRLHGERKVDGLLRAFQPRELPEYTLQPHLDDIDNVFSKSSVEDILSALASHHNPAWAQQQAETIRRMSPTSLKLAHRQLTEGAAMSFTQVFTMELRMAQRCLFAHDLHEGARAILIDKDRNPQWQPSTVEGVSGEEIDTYFHPLPDGKDIHIQE